MLRVKDILVKIMCKNWFKSMTRYLPIALHHSLSLSLPSDIRWHFIGRLQSNKVKALLQVPNLCVIETLDDKDKARRLDGLVLGRDAPLDVFIQVNTSGEEQKGGLSPQEALRLASFIQERCLNLRVAGLMTIGSLGHSQLEMGEGVGVGVENPDFARLFQCRKQMAETLKVSEDELELSMGMSSDYLQAVGAVSLISFSLYLD